MRGEAYIAGTGRPEAGELLVSSCSCYFSWVIMAWATPVPTAPVKWGRPTVSWAASSSEPMGPARSPGRHPMTFPSWNWLIGTLIQLRERTPGW